MKMKTLVVLSLGMSLSALAQQQQTSNTSQQGQGTMDPSMMQMMMASQNLKATTRAQTCAQKLRSPEGANLPGLDQQQQVDNDIIECHVLSAVAQGSAIDQTEAGGGNGIICKQTSGYTKDYKYCVSAANALTYVIAAESALNLEQQVRTDLKNKSIQQRANQQAAEGNLQTGIYDASIESNKHQKSMMQEKMVAYTAAVTALGMTYTKWPGKNKLIQTAKTECSQRATDQRVKDKCEATVTKYQGELVINDSAKSVLITKITEYIAKGVAAGIAAGQFDTAAKQVEAAKETVATEEGQDVMMERCVFNPTDPACAVSGNRVSGNTYSQGEFSMGDGLGNNAFNMGADSGAFGEDGEASNVGGDTVAAANSPFEDAAKKATGILDPAAAASVQPGSATAGGGGGVGGGGGGGSASLGSDLAGADKDGDKEAKLNATKSSGNYSAAGGGGYAAIKGGKDNANPFADLFGAKSSGGIEEDRSIASGDIDGAASGLFQKISKRYNQIQADKRIEANNVE